VPAKGMNRRMTVEMQLERKDGVSENRKTLRRARRGTSMRGFTLLELVVATIILSILAMAVLPLARFTIQREKERELRRALWQMRDAIDRYKADADQSKFQTSIESMGYPPDLDTLVKGVESKGGLKIKYLRSVPVDPMTRSKEWGFRSNADDVDSTSSSGGSVFDVYTKSEGTALDGTKYKDW
jgi:general secretion pathway protein G